MQKFHTHKDPKGVKYGQEMNLQEHHHLYDMIPTTQPVLNTSKKPY